MIITRIIGGIGNQMFQYAFGRNIAYRNNDQFKIDISGFRNYGIHKYRLNNFNTVENIVEKDEIPKQLLYSGSKRVLCKISEKMFKRIEVVNEKKYKHDIDISKNKNIYLQGYWQSENYFKGIEDIIRKEFKLKNPLSYKNSEILKKIERTNSVSIHFRRGD